MSAAGKQESEYDSNDFESSGDPSEDSGSEAPQPSRKRGVSQAEEDSDSNRAVSNGSDSAGDESKTMLRVARWSVEGLTNHPTAKEFYDAIKIGDKFSIERDTKFPEMLFVITDAALSQSTIVASFMLLEGGEYVPIRVRFGLNRRVNKSNFDRYILHMTIKKRVATVQKKSHVDTGIDVEESVKKQKSEPAATNRIVDRDVVSPVPTPVRSKRGRSAEPTAVAARSEVAHSVPSPVSHAVPHSVPHSVPSPVFAGLFEAMQLRYTEQVVQSMMENPEIIKTATDRATKQLISSPTFIKKTRKAARAKLISDQTFVAKVREEAILQERNNPALKAEVERSISLNLLSDFVSNPGEDLTGFEKDAIKRIMSGKK